MASRIEQLQEFLKASPKDAFLRHALALELVKLGDEIQAEQYFHANYLEQPDYLATYYHLAKLKERTGHVQEAIEFYELGMRVALTAKDRHTYSELQSACEDLMD
ncbi:MAG: hypothetical protein JST36_07030 [Bacteroidetes bacterium]|nr:hypothetical protein [Bacteroidota bacterium]